MGSELLRRVRWRNIARVVAAVGVVAVVVAWPRLAPAPPQLPDPVARPFLTAPATPPVVHDRRPKRRPPVVARAHARGEERGRRGARVVERRRANPGIEGGGGGDAGGGGSEGGRGGGVGGGGGSERGQGGSPGSGGPAAGGGTPSGGGGTPSGGGGAPEPAPPPRDPAQAEFGFER